MFKIVSTERMRVIEAVADASGIPYAKLMEYAGRAVADRALHILQAWADPKVTVLVGSGNNGGDGLVAGLFIAKDHPSAVVRFYLLKARDDEFTKAAKEANLMVVNAEDDHDKRLLKNMIASADLVIDALFGIGVRLPLREEAAQILRTVNQALHERRAARPDKITMNPATIQFIPHAPPTYVLAVDCPSGLDCDSGNIDKNAVNADETVTFIAAKTGQFLFPGAAAVGDLTISNAGVPQDFKELQQDNAYVVDASLIRRWLPVRPLEGNKGTFGKALIVGGSTNYVGAPALAAVAAYRSGTGLVTVATASNVASMLAPQNLEATWLMLPHDLGAIRPEAVAILLKELHKYDALLVGPGLGREKVSQEFLLNLLQAHTPPAAKRSLGFHTNSDTSPTNAEALQLPPLVLDADALNILSEQEEWWRLLPPHTIITPHPGEMARLAKLTTEEVQMQRWSLVQEKAAAWNVILLLKGAHTLVANPSGEMAVLPFKTSALAKAGTGDVLAGIIVGLLAQGMSPMQAAVSAAYLHGSAGTHATSHLGSRGLIASDIGAALGITIEQILELD